MNSSDDKNEMARQQAESGYRKGLYQEQVTLPLAAVTG